MSQPPWRLDNVKLRPPAENVAVCEPGSALCNVTPLRESPGFSVRVRVSPGNPVVTTTDT
ncbi:hypothetical protein [uncultured Pseudacidovorax sp.]|uniref:hypothetical protein n=1 Tax=uncultured Pseudacidovorax sp. TaxID=679313 RepID=UPI0025DF2665|nr:hypothetical protein [uncultured Pseudacidovorax sp.]